jgi:hypothetical protein
MAFRPTHELHRRRFSRNLGIGLLLAGFVALVFALTVVKVTRGDPMKGYDHRSSRRCPPEPTPGARSHEDPRLPPAVAAGPHAAGLVAVVVGHGLGCLLPRCRSTTGSAASPAMAAPSRCRDRADTHPGPHDQDPLRRLARGRDALGVPPAQVRDGYPHRRDRPGLLRGLQPDRPGRRAPPATTSRPMWPAAISPRSTASASRCRCCSPASG